MNVIEALDSRRTVRQYDPSYKIPREQLEKIVDVTLKSPTAMNVQDIDLLIVSNQNKLNEISETLMNNLPKPFHDNFAARREQLGVSNVVTCDASSVIFLITNDRSDPMFTQIDAGIVSMAIMAAAREYQLDTMCLGILIYGDKSKIEDVLQVPKGSLAMAVAIGKARPEHKEGDKKIICKATYVD